MSPKSSLSAASSSSSGGYIGYGLSGGLGGSSSNQHLKLNERPLYRAEKSTNNYTAGNDEIDFEGRRKSVSPDSFTINYKK